MTILAELVDVVVGVDTHKHTHTAAIVTNTGGQLAVLQITACPIGFAELEAAATAASPSSRRCWAIEGCGSWGRQLVRWLTERGEMIVEVERPKRPKRRMGIKNDAVDALRAAREALNQEQLCTPRGQGVHDALGAAQMARRSALDAATDTERQLLGLTSTIPEHLAGRLRGHTTREIVAICTSWRPDKITDPMIASVATTMRSMARRVTALRDEADQLERTIRELVNQWRPDLLDQHGVGPIVAATILGAWSHPGRIHSAGAFAMIAGCAPIEISTGLTEKHRLNPFGDRQLNRAIHVIAITRSRSDPRTIAYIERRRQQGKTNRDIRRCLKNYIAREIYELLEHPLDRT
jgi:transposase